MLSYLHVKNLAIIDEEEIEFSKGLNILSGETGTGKSIILGALGLAMGNKPIKGLIRNEDNDALVEAVFSVNQRQKAIIEAMDIELCDDEVILQRKITPQRTSSKINGENVPSSKLSEVANVLIDIYGQHEQQTLLSKKNHILLLDEYAGSELAGIKEALFESYDNYKRLSNEYENAVLDEGQRARETDLLTHEIAEIEAAKLKIGEDIELKEEYQRLSKSQKVLDAIKEAQLVTGESTADSLGRAIRSLRSVEDVDEKISEFIGALSDAENILSDIRHGLMSYEDELELSPERLNEVGSRIDLIDTLKRKYSKNMTMEEILNTLEENQRKLKKYEDYEGYLNELTKKLDGAKTEVYKLCEKIRYIRTKSALELTGHINEALKDLNFLGSGIEIIIEHLEEPKRTGMDDVVFNISTNPGEPARELNAIASGGELSRIMLAIKTIFAGSGEIDTLVFDEIDSGVSGKTAAKVAERLSVLSKNSQVICITHLPQIAAKADNHFLIEKIAKESSTVSSIKRLNDDERVGEVARMLAGDDITDAAILNAKALMA